LYILHYFSLGSGIGRLKEILAKNVEPAIDFVKVAKTFVELEELGLGLRLLGGRKSLCRN
jgi:hypothetical protein